MKPDRPWFGLANVWSSRNYRPLLLTNVLAGVSVSSYIPLIPLFLVQTLGADAASVGLFMLTFAAASFVGIAIGRLSDTRMSRVPLIMVVGVWVGFGRVAMSLAPGFGVAAVISVVFGTFSGVVNAQAFAVLRDVINRDREPREASVTSVVRTGYSFGWVIGPVIGAAAAAQLGYRAAIAASALIALAALVPLFSLRRLLRSPGREIDARVPGVDGVGPVTEGRSWGKRGLWMFAGASLLGLTAEAIRLTYLPILAVDRLGVPLGALGLLLALAPAVELAAMPAAGTLADRWGLKPMLAVGFGFGISGFVAFATSTSVAGLVAGQVLNACFIAIILGLGPTYAQQQHPSGAGFATSVFFGAQALSVTTAGLAGAGSADLIGLPGMFLVPAALCGAAGLLLVITPQPAGADVRRR